jgi:hypothetical protein
MQPDSDLLREQANKFIQSGTLGRSRSYVRLLEFLVDCAASGRTPKELEIAMEAFGRGADFDPSQDSMVRVYAHNLRQKLEHYYATVGRGERAQLTLARGEYRISLAANGGNDDVAAAAPADGPKVEPSVVSSVAAMPRPERRAAGARWRLAAAGLALLGIGLVVGIGVGVRGVSPPSEVQAIAAAPIWSGLLDDELPILIVVGDYYIFGELDAHGDVERLVRDFAVGSSKELDELMMNDPSLLGRYLDLDLTYLPTGTAFALVDVLRVLYTSDKPVRVVSMSEMNESDLKSSHVVYLGYISALDKLEDFVFASSSLTIGYTYDELRNVETGELYTSEAGQPEISRNYRDYALIATFPGPGGNQLVIVSGMRDAGLMQAAHALADPMYIASMERSRPDTDGNRPPAFEMLYEVTGYGRTNLDARLVHTAKLNYEQIWGGVFRQAVD